MLQENVIYNDRITVCRAQFCLTSTISLLLMLIAPMLDMNIKLDFYAKKSLC